MTSFYVLNNKFMLNDSETTDYKDTKNLQSC